MRFKNRYYLVEIIWDSLGTNSSSIHRVSDISLQSHQLQSALRESMLSHFGEFGLSRVLQSLQVRYLNSLTNLAIIRVARSDSRTLAALVTFLTQLRSKQILLRTIHLSGTIRNCQKRALQIQKHRLAELLSQISTTDHEDEAPVAGVLKTSTAHRPTKNAQQTLNQLASLLSQYNASKAQQAAAATSHAASVALASSSSSSKLSKAEQTVAPTNESIQAALQQIEQRSTEEIMAIDS